MQLVIVSLCIVLLANFAGVFSSKTFRIVDGIDKLNPDPEDALEKVSPKAYYGPDVLRALQGSCFNKSLDRFEYIFCPFHNVTQRRTGYNFRSNLIGVWGKWTDLVSRGHNLYEFSQSVYDNGDMCGIRDKRTTINIVCNSKTFEIDNIDDSQPCDVTMDFLVPFSCDILVGNFVYIDAKPPIINKEDLHFSSHAAKMEHSALSCDCFCPCNSSQTANTVPYEVKDSVALEQSHPSDTILTAAMSSDLDSMGSSSESLEDLKRQMRVLQSSLDEVVKLLIHQNYEYEHSFY